MWPFVSGFLHSVYVSSLHPCCCVQRCFFPFYGWTLFHCMVICFLFIQSSVGGHLDCFDFLAIWNAPANEHSGIWTCVFDSLEYIPRSEMSRSYGNSNFFSVKLFSTAAASFAFPPGEYVGVCTEGEQLCGRNVARDKFLKSSNLWVKMGNYLKSG